MVAVHLALWHIRLVGPCGKVCIGLVVPSPFVVVVFGCLFVNQSGKLALELVYELDF